MFKPSQIIVFLILALTLTACSSENAPSRKPVQKPVQMESAEDLRLSDLQAHLEQLESYAESQPTHLETILGQIENFKAEASGTGFVKKAENLAVKARERFAREAQAAYNKLRAEADKAPSARAAVALLGEYPPEFRSTEWQGKIDNAIKPLKKEADAYTELENLRDNVKEKLKDHNLEAAFELVEKFPEPLRKDFPKIGTAWKELHSELAPKVEAVRERRRKEDALPWEELFTGADMNEWEVQTGDWKVEDGCIACAYDGGQHAFISCGSEESAWDNFILELEFDIVKGNFLVLGVRGKNVSGHSEFDQISFTPNQFPSGRFHNVTVEARGDLYTISEKESKNVFTQKADSNYPKGFLGFFILPDSEVRIRKVRLKHLK